MGSFLGRPPWASSGRRPGRLAPRRCECGILTTRGRESQRTWWIADEGRAYENPPRPPWGGWCPSGEAHESHSMSGLHGGLGRRGDGSRRGPGRRAGGHSVDRESTRDPDSRHRRERDRSHCPGALRGAELVPGRGPSHLQSGGTPLCPAPGRSGAPAPGDGLRHPLQQRPRPLPGREVAGHQPSPRGPVPDLRPPGLRRHAPAGDAPGTLLLARLVAGRTDPGLLRPAAGRTTTSIRSPWRAETRHG